MAKEPHSDLAGLQRQRLLVVVGEVLHNHRVAHNLKHLVSSLHDIARSRDKHVLPMQQEDKFAAILLHREPVIFQVDWRWRRWTRRPGWPGADGGDRLLDRSQGGWRQRILGKYIAAGTCIRR